MRINCCHCGERDSGEFVCHGAVHGRRPGAQDGAPAFHRYVYLRDNVRGRHDEYWYHAYGCRAWLEVTRDTRTHEVIAVAVASEASGGHR
jgi:heterotetrameric sarcosine oxidase delta subunit